MGSTLALDIMRAVGLKRDSHFLWRGGRRAARGRPATRSDTCSRQLQFHHVGISR